MDKKWTLKQTKDKYIDKQWSKLARNWTKSGQKRIESYKSDKTLMKNGQKVNIKGIK